MCVCMREREGERERERSACLWGACFTHVCSCYTVTYLLYEYGLDTIVNPFMEKGSILDCGYHFFSPLLSGQLESSINVRVYYPLF